MKYNRSESENIFVTEESTEKAKELYQVSTISYKIKGVDHLMSCLGNCNKGDQF